MSTSCADATQAVREDQTERNDEDAGFAAATHNPCKSEEEGGCFCSCCVRDNREGERGASRPHGARSMSCAVVLRSSTPRREGRSAGAPSVNRRRYRRRFPVFSPHLERQPRQVAVAPLEREEQVARALGDLDDERGVAAREQHLLLGQQQRE